MSAFERTLKQQHLVSCTYLRRTKRTKTATATITRSRTTTAIAICPPRLTPAPPPPPPAPAELPVVTADDVFDVTDALSGGFVVAAAAAVDVVDAVVAFTDLVEVLLTTLGTFVEAATSAAAEVVLGLVVLAAAVELCSTEVASTETEVSSLSVGVGVVGGATVKLLVVTVVLLLGAAELEAVE